MRKDTEIQDAEIAEWLGDFEIPETIVANYQNKKVQLEDRFIAYARSRRQKNGFEIKNGAKNIDLNDFRISAAEVASALRYIKYFYNREVPEAISRGKGGIWGTQA